MIDPEIFLEALHQQGIHFFAGVPDSLMKGFLACVQEKEKNHVITANEGAAIAMAAGYHLATNEIALVYLQNSGIGNTINPLTSLVNKEVYGIPMLLMIGWRGQPGKKDEPQHLKMGQSTPEILRQLDIPYFVFGADCDWASQLQQASILTKAHSHPVALVIEEGFFGDRKIAQSNTYELSAQQVIEALYPNWDDNTIVLCTTGKIGRLFYAINRQHANRIKKYFLNVGAMGHVSSIAAGIAKFAAGRVVVLDGDGSLLMYMGSLPVLGSLKLDNLDYVLLNNGAHQSVGGQPTVGFAADFCGIAKGSGLNNVMQIETKTQFNHWLQEGQKHPFFTEFRINMEMPESLPRPKESFAEAKQNFMKALQGGNL